MVGRIGASVVAWALGALVGCGSGSGSGSGGGPECYASDGTCSCEPGDNANSCPTSQPTLAVACGVDVDDQTCRCESFTCDGESCSAAYGEADGDSVPAPSDGICCVDGSIGLCMCFSGDVQYCVTGGIPVDQCTAQVTADTYMDANFELVDDCDSRTPREPDVEEGGPSCTGLGSCGPAVSNCSCGSSCLHTGEGSYICGFECYGSDDTCTATENPVDKQAYSSCYPPRAGEFFDFDGYCQ